MPWLCHSTLDILTNILYKITMSDKKENVISIISAIKCDMYSYNLVRLGLIIRY